MADFIVNRKPFLFTIIDDFNARPNNWCSSEKTIYEVKKQVISDPTHVLKSSSSSRFNLYVATQFS